MPPVDRRNPIRANSSESTCNVLEFFREARTLYRHQLQQENSHGQPDEGNAR